MIRKLKQEDYQSVMTYLSEEAGLNLFLIGDIENYGFESPIQEVWGSFDETGYLNGVLLRYRENYIPYFKESQFDVSEFIEIIKSDPNIQMISGESKIVAAFTACFKAYEIREMYFCELTDALDLVPATTQIEIAEIQDSQRIFDLLIQIEEFDTLNRSSVEHVKEKFYNHSGRIYYIENEQGEVVCNVQTTAENSKSAMVVSVATHPDYRGRGYMSQALSKLCHDLLSEGKTLCLFYDNPKAGRVYHKLGFESIGKWSMMVKK
ncbi:MAG: GNAT family N-acetyltransferase [Turicibacter sp.]